MAEKVKKLIGRFLTEKPAKYLIVPLVPSRTPRRADALPIESDHPRVIIGNFSVGVEWDEAVPVGAGVELTGESIALEQRARWFVGDEELFDLLGEDEPQEFATALRASERQLLQAEYEEDPDPIDGITNGLKYRRFFKELDYKTHPSLYKIYLDDQSEKDKRCKQMHYVSWLLWKRIQKWEETESLPPNHELFGENADDQLNCSIKKLSTRQKEIYETHFKTAPSARAPSVMQWDWVGEAFDLFAAGHLKAPGKFFNYGPDSVNFFLFGEFARVAVERGYDHEFWNELLGPFTRAQRIFLKTYTKTNTDGKKQLVDPFESNAKLDDIEITNVRNSYANVTEQPLMKRLQSNIKDAYERGMKRTIICEHVGG